MAMDDREEQEKAADWIRSHIVDCAVAERAHRLLADKSRRYNYRLGIPIILLTTLVGTSSFYSLADLGQTRTSIAIATGIISVLAAVLAALQTFLHFEDDSKVHSEAATSFAGLLHTYRYLLSIPQAAIEPGRLYALDSEYSEVVSKQPPVPLAIEAEAKKAVAKEYGPDWKKYF
jgi:hypothetical protein